MSLSASQSATEQTTNNVDRRVTTNEGDILSLSDNNLTVNEGGSLTVVNKDPEAAYRAIDAIRGTSAELVAAVTNTATTLSRDSNKIASQVAESQSKFVETANGTKSVTYVVAIVAGVAALVALPLAIKSLRNK